MLPSQQHPQSTNLYGSTDVKWHKGLTETISGGNSCRCPLLSYALRRGKMIARKRGIHYRSKEIVE
jgi:hypothetical protein